MTLFAGASSALNPSPAQAFCLCLESLGWYAETAIRLFAMRFLRAQGTYELSRMLPRPITEEIAWQS